MHLQVAQNNRELRINRAEKEDFLCVAQGLRPRVTCIINMIRNEAKLQRGRLRMVTSKRHICTHHASHENKGR